MSESMLRRSEENEHPDAFLTHALHQRFRPSEENEHPDAFLTHALHQRFRPSENCQLRS